MDDFKEDQVVMFVSDYCAISGIKPYGTLGPSKEINGGFGSTLRFGIVKSKHLDHIVVERVCYNGWTNRDEIEDFSLSQERVDASNIKPLAYFNKKVIVALLKQTDRIKIKSSVLINKDTLIEFVEHQVNKIHKQAHKSQVKWEKSIIKDKFKRRIDLLNHVQTNKLLMMAFEFLSDEHKALLIEETSQRVLALLR